MPAVEDRLADKITQACVDIGIDKARDEFAKRGNHSEVHIDEHSLSVLLARAAIRGARAVLDEVNS